VHLVVDHPGHQDLARRVDHFDPVGRRDSAADLRNSFAFYQHIGITHLTLVCEASVGNQ